MEGVLGYEVWLNPLLPRFSWQGRHQGLGYPNHLLASETVPIGTSFGFPVYCICSDATNHSKLPLFQQLYFSDITRSFLYYAGVSE
jgi:hypothetical protein